jgi:hypothetical protein
MSQQGKHKVCNGCHTSKPASDFHKDKSRPDGLTYLCFECRNQKHKSRYKPKPGLKFGPAPSPARSGDKRQARKRVNQLVLAGKLKRPNDVPCFDCGHIHHPGERRHEYDHYLGYEAEHHTHVQAVCTRCHRARDKRTYG